MARALHDSNPSGYGTTDAGLTEAGSVRGVRKKKVKIHDPTVLECPLTMRSMDPGMQRASPRRPTVAWLNGLLVSWADARVPIEDRGLMFGESVYEVIPVAAGRARRLADHELRMREAARELGIDRGLPSLEDWRRVAGELLRAESIVEGLIYAQLTGGSAPRMHVPSVPVEPTFFAYVQEHRFPRNEDLSRGLRVVTARDTRWERCDLKTTMLLPAVLAKREASRRGADEALWLSPENDVREGSSSNVFLVESGRILSPEVDSHVLPGVTRLLLAEAARDAGLPIGNEPIPLERLLRADEVFLTSTSRLAMPVLSVDDRVIGAGVAGQVTLDLARRMRVRLDLEPER